MHVAPCPLIAAALGAMTFGTPRWGSPDEVSRAIFDACADAGGNFIATADVYAGGRREELLGGYIADRTLRDHLVIAIKFTRNAAPVNPDAGRIRYCGFPDVPAWYATKAATLAAAHAVPGSIALQLEYSLVERSIEREHVPADIPRARPERTSRFSDAQAGSLSSGGCAELHRVTPHANFSRGRPIPDPWPHNGSTSPCKRHSPPRPAIRTRMPRRATEGQDRTRVHRVHRQS